VRRRTFIAAAAAAPFFAKAALADTTTLRSAAASAGIMYGANARDYALIQQYPDLANLMAEQCALVESGHDFQWYSLRPNPTSFDFSQTDAWMAWAQSKALKVAECHLIWHGGQPKWLKHYLTPQNAREMLTNHVSTVVGRYAGKMYSWVVVNEAIHPGDGRSDGLRNDSWLQNAGPDYIDLAFHTAAQADPSAILVYNDDNMDLDAQSSIQKRKFVLNLLQGMKSRGVPIHALGIQGHLPGDPAGYTGPGFAAFLSDVASLGLKVFITELDLLDVRLGNDDATRDNLSAKDYDGYLGTAVQNKNLTTVISWSLADKYNWRNQWDPNGSAKGGVVRGLPFGSNLEPTPVFNAMVSAFRSAPKR
jgi:endo-1,4-beta-xylanase